MMDLNCDLGEGEDPRRTRALMRWITSANIACGGHAGDQRSLRRCLRLCGDFGVRAGAHPGLPGAFGRRARPVSAEALVRLLETQTDEFCRAAREVGVRPRHIKLHGALYHMVERSPALARSYIDFVQARFPRWTIFAWPDGVVAHEAARAGVTVWGEIFADRAYGADGRLVPRGKPGAVLEDSAEIVRRVAMFLEDGVLPAGMRGVVRPCAQTICLHADSPVALRAARGLANLLSARRRGRA